MEEKTEIVLDYSKLRGRIVEKFGSVRAFSQELNVQQEGISHRLHNGKCLSHKSIMKWAQVLDISQERIGIYFFTVKVPKVEQE